MGLFSERLLLVASEATLGGTSIQAWSSADALAACSAADHARAGSRSAAHADDPKPLQIIEPDSGAASDADPAADPEVDPAAANGGLFNGLIAPLLSNTIKGVVWCKYDLHPWFVLPGRF